MEYGRAVCTYHHVGVADRLHFVDLVALDDRVEQGIQIVEEAHHLMRLQR